MRVIALLCAHNEERYIEACLEHLVAHGVEVYLCDHGSTDETVERASRFLGRGLIAIEPVARDGRFEWQALLTRKEELGHELDADWFLHADPDEIHLPPEPTQTLARALTDVDRQGYNAVNFFEFTFVPTREAPDHEHPRFQQTMRRYYPYAPWVPHRLTAWKKQPEQVDLAWSGGHMVRFPGLRPFPRDFVMKHYLYLSARHALEKYVHRTFDPSEVRRGWHSWRAMVEPGDIELPSDQDLYTCVSDDLLNRTGTRTTHLLEDRVKARLGRAAVQAS